MKLKDLVGSGDKIGLLTAPFLIVGLILNILFPSWFSVGGPSNVSKDNFHNRFNSRGRHLDLVGRVDPDGSVSEKTDHQRALFFNEAPALYRRGFTGASMGWFSIQLLAGRFDRRGPVYWIEAVFACRRRRIVKDFWARLGGIPPEGTAAVAVRRLLSKVHNTL